MDLISVSHQSLRRIRMIHDMPTEAIERLREHCSFRYYDAKQSVVHARECDDSVYMVVRGLVRVTLYGADGYEMIIRDISEGEIFGELAGLTHNPRCANVYATLPTTLAILPARVFGDLLEAYPAASRKLLEQLAGQIRDLTSRMFELGTYNVRKRIYADLLRLAGRRIAVNNTAVISPPPLHAEIAGRVGTHREAVTKELSRLARAGIIEKRKGAIEIRQVEHLQHLLDRAA